MPAGLVLSHGRAHGARMAAQPAEAVGARCKPPGRIPGLAAANAGGGDTMNALAANDVEAADLPPEPAAAPSPATIQAPGPGPGTRRRAAQPGNR
jgi:hypothetical protein